MRDSHWLCLDCSKDTYDEYYGVHNHLWRRVVDRSQRHGMLCLSCLELRLGRLLRFEDFKNVPSNGPIAQFLAQRPISGNASDSAGNAEQAADFDDSPMDWDDYGLIDELTVEQLRGIDSALMSLATVKPRKVAAIIGRTMIASPARVPGLPDYFYLERVRLLVEGGELRALGDVDDLIKCEVLLP
jgi:hypothetical protein